LCGLEVFISYRSGRFTAEIVWHWCFAHDIPRLSM
jgi:hypothetical protein